MGIFLTMLAFAFRDEEEIEIPADQIARFEQANQAEIAV
jgi:cytochrome o ubiquinol oxidase subunit I